MVDTGPMITPPGQYTHCVDRADYQDPPPKSDRLSDVMARLIEAGVPSILGSLLCDYLLGGKLVCLAGGGDECAIGVVVGLEPVGEGKHGIEQLDNDFSFNVLLAPFVPQDFEAYAPGPGGISYAHDPRNDAVNGPVGWLMADTVDPSTLPEPRDQAKGSTGGHPTYPVDGYGVKWDWDAASSKFTGSHPGDNLRKLEPCKDSVALPVVHCECEGSRIFFVCQAMHPFIEALAGQLPGTGFSPGGACHAVARHLFWPVNKIVHAVCSLVEDLAAIPIAIALAPAMAAAFAAAWELAQAFDDLLVTGPVAKQIQVGDAVIVHGRWVWDAGHSGHTELHPVKAIQKLSGAPPGEPPNWLPPQIRPASVTSYNPKRYSDTGVGSVGGATAEIRATYEQWCRLASEGMPPADPRSPGGVLSPPQIAALTPAQLAVWQAQNLPENTWTVHPLIDGCAPNAQPEWPNHGIR